MELRHLSYFVTVAEELHFAHAAARLEVAQPALSKQIRQLERELGVPLLERTTRSVRLTSAGAVFLEDARRALWQVERAKLRVKEAERGEAGELRIGFVTSAGYDLLPAMLREYHARFPAVELKPYHMPAGEQIKGLEERRLDVGVIRPPVRSESLTFEVVCSEEFLLALPDGHPLAQLESVPIEALASEAFISSSSGVRGGPNESLTQLFHEAGFQPRSVQDSPDLLTILGLVAAGIGISLVPAVAREVRTAGLVYRELEGESPLQFTGLAWRRDEQSAVLRGFLDVARSVARSLGHGTAPNWPAGAVP